MCDNSSVAIKNGSSDGKTELANKSKPVLDACRLLFEKIISPIVNKQNIAGIIFFLIDMVSVLNLFFFIFLSSRFQLILLFLKENNNCKNRRGGRPCPPFKNYLCIKGKRQTQGLPLRSFNH